MAAVEERYSVSFVALCLAVLAVVGSLIPSVIYNIYRHLLASVSGLKLAGITYLYQAYFGLASGGRYYLSPVIKSRSPLSSSPPQLNPPIRSLPTRPHPRAIFSHPNLILSITHPAPGLLPRCPLSPFCLGGLSSTTPQRFTRAFATPRLLDDPLSTRPLGSSPSETAAIDRCSDTTTYVTAQPTVGASHIDCIELPASSSDTLVLCRNAVRLLGHPIFPRRIRRPRTH